MKKYTLYAPGGAAIQAFSADAISFSTGAASVIVIATKTETKNETGVIAVFHLGIGQYILDAEAPLS